MPTPPGFLQNYFSLGGTKLPYKKKWRRRNAWLLLRMSQACSLRELGHASLVVSRLATPSITLSHGVTIREDSRLRRSLIVSVSMRYSDGAMTMDGERFSFQIAPASGIPVRK